MIGYFRQLRRAGGGSLLALTSALFGSRNTHRTVVLQLSLYLCALLALHALPIPQAGSETLVSVFAGLQTSLSTTIVVASLANWFAPNRDLPFIGRLNRYLRPDDGITLWYEVLVLFVGPLVSVVEAPLAALEIFKFTRRLEARIRVQGTSETVWKVLFFVIVIASFGLFGGVVHSLSPHFDRRLVYAAGGGAAVFVILALINPDGNVADAALTLAYVGVTAHFGQMEVQLHRGLLDDLADKKLLASFQMSFLASSVLFAAFTTTKLSRLGLSAVACNLTLCMSVTFRALLVLGGSQVDYNPILWRGLQVAVLAVTFVGFMFFGEDNWLGL